MAILERIKRHQINFIGHETEQLIWPVNRSQALELLNYFCTYCLPLFGRFQDAMTHQGDSRWSLYHARISFALNSKILSPMEVVEAALSEFYKPETNEAQQISRGLSVRLLAGGNMFVVCIGSICPTTNPLTNCKRSCPCPTIFGLVIPRWPV